MDRRIFKQLDDLERVARDERSQTVMPQRDGRKFTNSQQQARWSNSEAASHHGRAEHRQRDGARNEYAGQPMDVDLHDEELPGQRVFGSRHAQLLMQPRETHSSRQARHGHELSRLASRDEQPNCSSSSPSPQHWMSSPSSRATRRPEAAMQYGRESLAGFAMQSKSGDLRHTRHAPYEVEQIEAEEWDMQNRPAQLTSHVPPSHAQARASYAIDNTNIIDTPIIRGIGTVSTHEIPDSFRSIFPFPLFNVVQSKSFETVYKGNDNFVLSAPTGSGKTAILELAICRLMNMSVNGSYKIVYQAPTKSLCAERQRDWQAKFGPLGLQCAELTGDTEGGAQLRNVKNATIIITTPEKWDSMTRKWKDHQKLMLMVKLFLIDEVHILKEDRGATLEAVVSRMKSIESNVRFIALSATVPNSEDIASWLGQDQLHPWLPAAREVFDESVRPVPLQKHVCGYPGSQNEFAFEKILTGKLPEVICRYSQGKPVMIFCVTRNSCAETAKTLAEWWNNRSPVERHWNAPRNRVTVSDKDLRDTISSGVAFHHAGLTLDDRTVVEKAYLNGEVNVICCTSTLAVGVNLPCHMVIVKHTVSYGGPGVGCKEYSDLEVMQMLGRAGRPQFDDSAIAVIMTRAQKVQHYEKMVTGTEVLESCLHLNLIDHLNSEIGLGTITSAAMAKKWLKGTFLYVRLKQNPEHYKIDGSTPGRTLDERLENICRDGIAALEKSDLVDSRPKLHCTEFGDAMARYYLQFGTMKILLSLQPHSKISEILSVISQATEFADVRFRANERPTYKELNKNNCIKFPIPVNLDSPAHKVSLVIQSVLGAVELPTEDPKQKNEYATARTLIFQHANRFIKCIIDCQLHLEDAITARNALMLSRSLGAQVWDDSPIHMKQLEAIGIVSVRKLAAAQIKSIEELEHAEAHRIETVLSRYPPFGTQILTSAKLFPKLRVSIKLVGEPLIQRGEHVTIRLNVDIGFLNERVPEYFNRRPVYVCMLAERSDGLMVHFVRASAKKLSKGHEMLISVELLNASQSVRAYVMCDEIAGTMRYATLNPDIPPGVFPPSKIVDQVDHSRIATRVPSRRAAPSGDTHDGEDFGDAEIDDADLASAEDGGFASIDDFDDDRLGASKPDAKKRRTMTTASVSPPQPSRQLANGNWACNHACKDKTSCKHMCCREGLEKRPKPRAAKKVKTANSNADPKQTQLTMRLAEGAPAEQFAGVGSTASLASKRPKMSQDARNLSHLHESVKNSTRANLTLSDKSLTLGWKHGKNPHFNPPSKQDEDALSDYGLDSWGSNDLPDVKLFVQQPSTTQDNASLPRVVDFDDDGCEMLDLVDDGEPPQMPNKTDTTQDTIKPSRPATKARAKPSPPLFLQSTSSTSAALRSSPSRSAISSPSSGSTFKSANEVAFVLGTPILERSTSSSTPIIHEGYVPIEHDQADFAVLESAPHIPEADAAPAHDKLEEWFKEEFGTELFDYIG